jgi:3-deoxy-D-manno-octulosonate 8-phosphate phosphatase (KDO 8-P phosphatase)
VKIPREILSRIRLVVFDIDGTLTDGTTTWLGPQIGWTQTYSTRDGEAILRAKLVGLAVVPLSRNKTQAARERMAGLDLPLDWLGVADKNAGFDEIERKYGLFASEVLFVGDGAEDAPILSRAGIGWAVRDAHPSAREAANYVSERRGGERVLEEVLDLLIASRAPSPVGP